MYGSDFQRSWRLIKYLFTNPADIPKYISTCLGNRFTPVDLELPWISYSAINFLKSFLKPDFLVGELGSGGSTIFFAKRSGTVISIESDETWSRKIKDKLSEKNLNNVVLKTYPYDPYKKDEFRKSSFLRSMKDYLFDIILVDCLDPSSKLRQEAFYFTEKQIKKGGLIVVDDSWRYPEIRKNNNAKHWTEFRSIGPCRKGITTTDIYFY